MDSANNGLMDLKQNVELYVMTILIALVVQNILNVDGAIILSVFQHTKMELQFTNVKVLLLTLQEKLAEVSILHRYSLSYVFSKFPKNSYMTNM